MHPNSFKLRPIYRNLRNKTGSHFSEFSFLLRWSCRIAVSTDYPPIDQSNEQVCYSTLCFQITVCGLSKSGRDSPTCESLTTLNWL